MSTRAIDLPRFGVGTAQLRTALEQALRAHGGQSSRIVALERRPSAYGSSFAIEELDVRLDDGATLEIIFKNLSRQALLEPARTVKPAFLDNPRREIGVYRTILAAGNLGTAVCYGATVDPRRGRYWLFLERVPGTELYQVGEFSVWQQVARWLAAMHARLAEQRAAQPPADRPSLLIYDAAFYRRWMRRARAFVGRSHPALAGSTITWLAERHDRVVERLLALPATWIHGEFYASNVLVQGAGDRLRVCPVDWEMAAVGPALVDLAALTTGRWSDAERTALALAYHGSQTAAQRAYMPDEFLTALDCCHLHLAIQWLGWSPAWHPPRDHAQDWLAEALRVAERLEL